LSALAGVAVIISIPIAGILLIAALLVLPGLTSIQVARSFRETMVLSPVFGLTSVVVGLLVSLVLDVAPGATIVLSVLGILLGVRRGLAVPRQTARREASLDRPGPSLSQPQRGLLRERPERLGVSTGHALILRCHTISEGHPHWELARGNARDHAGAGSTGAG